jgi:hypothetical protein
VLAFVGINYVSSSEGGWIFYFLPPIGGLICSASMSHRQNESIFKSGLKVTAIAIAIAAPLLVTLFMFDFSRWFGDAHESARIQWFLNR